MMLSIQQGKMRKVGENGCSSVQRTNIIDTIGFCDSVFTPKQVLDVINDDGNADDGNAGNDGNADYYDGNADDGNSVFTPKQVFSSSFGPIFFLFFSLGIFTPEQVLDVIKSSVKVNVCHIDKVNIIFTS